MSEILSFGKFLLQYFFSKNNDPLSCTLHFRKWLYGTKVFSKEEQPGIVHFIVLCISMLFLYCRPHLSFPAVLLKYQIEQKSARSWGICFIFTHCQLLAQLAEGQQLLSWRCVRRPFVNSSFKTLLLRNYSLDFYQTSQEFSFEVLFQIPSNNCVP